MKSRGILLISLIVILTIGIFLIGRNMMQATQRSAIATVVVQATQDNAATMTAAVSTLQNIYPPYKGKLLMNASMQNNTKSGDWNESVDPAYGFCKFTAGAYHVEAIQTGQFYYCSNKTLTLSNFAYQAQVTILKGDEAGLSFRSPSGGSLYYFYIDTKGHYELDVNRNHNFLRAVTSGTNPVIKTGYHQTNLLGVVAQGNSFDLYVNLQQVAHGSDATFSSGLLGLIVVSTKNTTEAEFQNAKAWSL